MNGNKYQYTHKFWLAGMKSGRIVICSMHIETIPIWLCLYTHQIGITHHITSPRVYFYIFGVPPMNVVVCFVRWLIFFILFNNNFASMFCVHRQLLFALLFQLFCILFIAHRIQCSSFSLLRLLLRLHNHISAHTLPIFSMFHFVSKMIKFFFLL